MLKITKGWGKGLVFSVSYPSLPKVIKLVITVMPYSEVVM
mgnify:CR=1 FL=1